VVGAAGEPTSSGPKAQQSLREPQNDELQRTSDGNAAGSPLNSVFGGPDAVEWPEVNDRLFRACRLMM
jgi:hypothetical protein